MRLNNLASIKQQILSEACELAGWRTKEGGDLSLLMTVMQNAEHLARAAEMFQRMMDSKIKGL